MFQDTLDLNSSLGNRTPKEAFRTAGSTPGPVGSCAGFESAGSSRPFFGPSGHVNQTGFHVGPGKLTAEQSGSGADRP
jgi:hypothetical protein